MTLSPDAFNAFLNDVGQRFARRPAFACPCRDPDSGSVDPDCPNCSGKGYAWGAPVEGMSGIAGQKIQRAWAEFGMWESGDVVLSIPSDSALYGLGEFDRVAMLDTSSPFSTLTTGVALRWPVVSLERAYYLDAAGVPVELEIDGATFSRDGVPAGVAVSVTGRWRPEYFCFGEFPSDRAHHSGETLPRRVVLRRFDLFGR